MARFKAGGFVIEDPGQIRLLGSPLRSDIVDYLEGAGPTPVAGIARGVGRPADRLYYHLRRLEEAGLVVRRGGGARDAALFDVPGRPVTLRYRADDPDSVEAIRDAVGTALRSAERHFGEALGKGEVELAGPTRNLWATRARGFLTDDQLREANELIHRILSLFRIAGETPAGRMHEVTIVVDPLVESAG